MSSVCPSSCHGLHKHLLPMCLKHISWGPASGPLYSLKNKVHHIHLVSSFISSNGTFSQRALCFPDWFKILAPPPLSSFLLRSTYCHDTLYILLVCGSQTRMFFLVLFSTVSLDLCLMTTSIT